MSQANLEKLSWVLEQLFNSRRIHPDLLAPEAEWVNPPDAVEPGTRRGAESFNGAIASVFAAWDDVQLDTERANHWLDVGAQPSDTVRSLLRKAGVLKARHEARLGRKLNSAAVPVREATTDAAAE